MSNVGKKLAGDDGSEVEEHGSVGADDERGDRAMQTESGNSVVDVGAAPTIDVRIQRHLGRKLKESYDELVRQPVPDKFHQLLEELERQEKKQ